MRWLFHTENNEIGGTEIQLRLLFSYLEKKQVLLYLIAPHSKVCDFLAPDCKVLPLPKSAFHAKQIFENLQLNGVITVSGKMTAILAAAKNLKIPAYWLCGYHPNKLSLDAAPLFALADKVIVCSRFLEEEMLTFTEDQIQYIPWGVELEKFSPFSLQEKLIARKKLNISKNIFLLGYSARFAAYKNHRFLFKVLKKLERLNCGLLCLSPSAPPSSLDAPPNVFFRKIAPHEMNEALCALDVYVNPAEEEGLGVATLEAMAKGIPVIVSNSGGAPEPLHYGRVGFLCKLNDVYSFCRAIEFLQQNPNQARLYSQNGPLIVERQYNFKNTAEQFFSLLKQEAQLQA